jgi:predicted AAA+ superfamily ATPase
MRFRHRHCDHAEQSFFLFGPRGTGKSTWCRRQFADAVFVDLLQADERRRFTARPERLRELAHQQPNGRTFVIDEVQKVPELLSVVHGLIEEHCGWQFVLTGSSARKLRRGGVDLMAGRALWREMHPYMASELGKSFDLERALRQGMVPSVVEADSPADVLKSYAGLYLEREVQAEGLVRNLSDFARFLEVASFSHGQTLNVSNIARECEVERTTVSGYIGILEDLLLAYRVPVFTKRARRAMVAHPKLYYFDTGVYRSLRPTGPLDRADEVHGAALEGLVAQHLRAWIAYGTANAQLHYWRTRGGSEVDFVVYGSDGFAAIEVKNAASVQRRDLRGLRTFGDDYPEASLVLLHRGPEALRIDGIPCIPCEEFVARLVPGSPLPL